MSTQPASFLELEFQPVTSARWQDLETLFGKNGAYGNCWCMWWRMSRTEFDKQTGEVKKEAFKTIVSSGEIPGILAYADGRPIAWCSVAPREVFPVLEKSRTLKRVDDKPVWSIVCFFVARPYRRQGLMIKMLQTAVEFAKEHGAQIVEGYPIESRHDNLPDVSSFTGIASVFSEAGFVEVLRRSKKRPIMRYFVEK
jgi:GNAT superfamily N-acetyltransferase